MSNYNLTESEIRIRVLLKLAPWLLIMLIVIIGIIKSCVGSSIDPMDNNINATREIVDMFNVVDSTNNGFRIVYATENNVTMERLKEIQNRQHIKDAFSKLKTEAPLHFGNMIETDIYDFADFAVKYDCDKAIKIHNIFISGKAKTKLYAQNNPKIKDCATWINSGTEQGVQYLKKDDIYLRREKDRRIYRYWKCYGLNEYSFTDERFIHFSEKERIW